MKIGDRDLSTIVKAAFQTRHYRAAGNMLGLYECPAEMLNRYLFKKGEYPTSIRIRTPLGPVPLDLYSHHDLLTVNEIFCRHDYQAGATDKVIVDFGSNIGISAAYFLSRNPDARAYLFEPLPTNIQRLRKNLARFEDRYVLEEAAVGEAEGEVEFGWELTGRYGGVGIQTGNYLKVRCMDSNRVLEKVLSAHGRIDILKVDIESLEKQVTERLPIEMARKIGKIYVEYHFQGNPLEKTHRHVQYGSVSQFFPKE